MGMVRDTEKAEREYTREQIEVEEISGK